MDSSFRTEYYNPKAYKRRFICGAIFLLIAGIQIGIGLSVYDENDKYIQTHEIIYKTQNMTNTLPDNSTVTKIMFFIGFRANNVIVQTASDELICSNNESYSMCYNKSFAKLNSYLMDVYYNRNNPYDYRYYDINSTSYVILFWIGGIIGLIGLCVVLATFYQCMYNRYNKRSYERSNVGSIPPIMLPPTVFSDDELTEVSIN